MAKGREIIIIGDRLLIAPDTDKTRTGSGLYLPQGLAEKEKVQTGRVAKVGPGYVAPHTEGSEPWQAGRDEPRYIPLQVREGDYAIFLRREATEIEYEGEKYLIVPQTGVLAVVRESVPEREMLE